MTCLDIKSADLSSDCERVINAAKATMIVLDLKSFFAYAIYSPFIYSYPQSFNHGGIMKKTLPEFTREEIYTLSHQKNSKLCLVGLFGKVYNLSKFKAEHPGGEKAIVNVAGDIIDDVFEDGNHSRIDPSILEKYEYGILKK